MVAENERKTSNHLGRHYEGLASFFSPVERN